jgi:hypothetical protein
MTSATWLWVNEPMLAEMRKQGHLMSWRQPMSWGMSVRRHWTSAEILYDRALAAKKRNDKRREERIQEAFSAARAGTFKAGERYLEGEELEDYLEEELVQDYFLMIGYALECAFKGALFGLLPQLITEACTLEKVMDHDNQRKKIILSHDLSMLCDECGMEVSEEESKLLRYLTFQVESGKYPAPIEYPARIPSVGPDLFVAKPIADELIQRAFKLLLSQRLGGRAGVAGPEIRTSTVILNDTTAELGS